MSRPKRYLLIICWVSIFSFYLFQIFSIPAWFDEAFTMQQSRLSLNRLARDSLFGFDIVHFVYYFICHLLLAVIGDSILVLRLLSLLVTFLTSWNVFRIGRKIYNFKVGLLSSGIYVLLPITFDYATQARSSALVTFLVSIIILNILDLDEYYSKISVAKANIFFWLQVSMNFTSIILVPIYLCLIRLRNPQASLVKEFKKRFIIPLISVIPLIIIAKGQEKQILWIGNEYSPIKEIGTIFLFPFVESENRYRGLIWVIPMVTLVLLLSSSLLKTKSEKSIKKLNVWLISLLFFPPLMLWLASFVHPIFLTRYIAYASLPFALIWGISLEKQAKRSVQVLISIVILIFGLMNIFYITDNRDSHFNWKEKYALIKQSEKDSVVISSPDWYMPMLKYYAKDDRKIDQITSLENSKKLHADGYCELLPRSIWLVGISDKIEASDSDRIRALGYLSTRSNSKIVPGTELFSLGNCAD